MSLFITSLNSGSNGNCYYIGNDDEAVLVDAGLSCRETERRMARLGLSVKRVKAIFVSHEHTDHVRGLAGLALKYALRVYVTDATKPGCYHLKTEHTYSFSPFVSVSIGSLSITAFPKFHDAADPHSFIISCKGITVGVFTDIGTPCQQLASHFKLCHAAFLESNYDEEMLENGNYPYFLKNRIRGGKGHLSNKQALDIFINNRPKTMSHLFLAHLSKQNNCPDLVQRLFDGHAGNTKIIVASRYAETPVYVIGNTKIKNTKGREAIFSEAAQMSLF